MQILLQKNSMLDVEKRGVDITLLLNAINDYKEAANLARKKIVIFDPVPLINTSKILQMKTDLPVRFTWRM